MRTRLYADAGLRPRLENLESTAHQLPGAGAAALAGERQSFPKGKVTLSSALLMRLWPVLG